MKERLCLEAEPKQRRRRSLENGDKHPDRGALRVAGTLTRAYEHKQDEENQWDQGSPVFQRLGSTLSGESYRRTWKPS